MDSNDRIDYYHYNGSSSSTPPFWELKTMVNSFEPLPDYTPHPFINILDKLLEFFAKIIDWIEKKTKPYKSFIKKEEEYNVKRR